MYDVCPRCGSAQSGQTSNTSFHCPLCGYSENDLVFRGFGSAQQIDQTPYTPPETPPYQEPYNGSSLGWICPKCGRGVSPYTSVCPCVGDKSIVYSNLTSVT